LGEAKIQLTFEKSKMGWGQKGEFKNGSNQKKVGKRKKDFGGAPIRMAKERFAGGPLKRRRGITLPKESREAIFGGGKPPFI